MMDGRVPRPAGDNIQLGGILYQLNGAVVRGDMIVYTASVLDQEVWENILIRELYPCNNGIRRLENKEISITSDGFDMFLAAKSTAHQAQRLEQHWLQPYGGGSSFVEAYGTLYTVRTFQKAVPLDAMLCQSPIPLATALTLLNQLLEKVNDLHNAGLLHLHISPKKIYLLPDTHIILDYDCLFDKTHPEGYGCVEAPSCYDAPEIRLGNIQEICEAADLYSCCAIFFEMLLGRPLQEIDVLGKRLLHTLSQFLPPDLGSILFRGLHTLPNRRFHWAAELQQALTGLQPFSSYQHITP